MDEAAHGRIHAGRDVNQTTPQKLEKAAVTNVVKEFPDRRGGRKCRRGRNIMAKLPSQLGDRIMPQPRSLSPQRQGARLENASPRTQRCRALQAG